MRAFVAELLSLARWQLLARAVVLVAPLVVLAAAAQLADGALPTAVLLVVVGLGALTAACPDSHAGSAALVVLVWVWLARVDRTTSPWVVAAAVAVAAFHTAAALAAFAPAGATLDPGVRDRWARRFGLLVGAVVASWALVAGIDRTDTGPNGALFVAGLTIVGVGAWGFLRSGRPS